MFKRSNMVIFLFLGIKTSAFTACVLSNLLRNCMWRYIAFCLFGACFCFCFVVRYAPSVKVCAPRKLIHACAYPRIKHCRRTNSGNAERERTRRLLLFLMGKAFYLLVLSNLLRNRTVKEIYFSSRRFLRQLILERRDFSAIGCYSLFRYLRQLTLFRHRNATCRLRLLLLFGLIWKTVFRLAVLLVSSPNFVLPKTSDMAMHYVRVNIYSYNFARTRKGWACLEAMLSLCYGRDFDRTLLYKITVILYNCIH